MEGGMESTLEDIFLEVTTDDADEASTTESETS